MSGTRAITLSLSVRDADTVRQQLLQMGEAGETALKRLDDAAKRAAGRSGIGGIGDAAQGASSRASAAFSALSSQGMRLLAVLGAGGGVAGALTSLVRSGDDLTSSLTRLRQATGSVASAADVYERLYQNALRTGVAVGEGVEAFQRFAIAARAIGATREQVLQLVTGLQRVAIVSGASGQEISSATLQLAQALASGVLQGDELRSILESMPVLAAALAGQLGVSVGQLRQMGAEGQLTADRVFPALLRATQEIGREFEAAPLTVERAFGSLSAAANRFLAQLNEATGLSRGLAAALAGAAAALDGARRGIGGLSAEEELAQMRARANALSGAIGRAEAQGTGPSLRAPASRSGIRSGLTGAAATQAGATPAGDLAAMRDEYFALLAEIETRERASIADRLSEQESAARQAAASRRQRAQQQITELSRALDAEFKARQDHERRVRQLREAEAAGAITAAERQRLEGLADRERDEALRRAAGETGRGGGGGRGSGTRAATEATRDYTAALTEQRQLIQSLETPYETYVRRLEELAALQDRLTAAQQAGVAGAAPLSDEQIQRAAERLGRDLERAEQQTERTSNTARELQMTFASAFEDAVIKGKDLSEVLKGIEQDLARIILRQAVVQPLANAASSAIGAGLNFLFPSSAPAGGGVSTASGNALGNAFAGGNVIPFALGGVVNGPTLFPMANGMGLMGEAGPEAVMPLDRDSSGRLGVRARGASSGGVVQNITIDARGADPTVVPLIRAAMAQAKEQAKAELLAEIDRGGRAAKVVRRRA